MVYIIKKERCILRDESIEPDIYVDDEALKQLMTSEEVRMALLNHLNVTSICVGRMGIKKSEDLCYSASDTIKAPEDLLVRYKSRKEFGYYDKL